MPNKWEGSGMPKRREPQWRNLKEDILDLFVEAQHIVSEDARTVRARIHAYRAYMNRAGFNKVEFGARTSFYAKQKARYSNYKIEPLEPPNDPALVCASCGYKAHTRQQLSSHRSAIHGRCELGPLNTSASPIVFTGSSEQIAQLRRMGWL